MFVYLLYTFVFLIALYISYSAMLEQRNAFKLNQIRFILLTGILFVLLLFAGFGILHLFSWRLF